MKLKTRDDIPDRFESDTAALAQTAGRVPQRLHHSVALLVGNLLIVLAWHVCLPHLLTVVPPLILLPD